MIKVYIASPYTLGDVAVNVKKQIEVANTLMDYGYAPFVPLLSHFQHMMYPRPYEDWVKVDMEWVEFLDIVLRLEGESKGADKEVAFAEELGIPVYYGLSDFLIQRNHVDVRP